MAKTTVSKKVSTTKSPKKGEQKTGIFKKYVTLKNVVIAIILLIAAFQAYKYLVDQYNIRLLDRAEAKMRQIDFPGDVEPVIERYCSERSVKFGSPGRPNCGVRISVMYGESNTVNNDNTTQVLDSLKNSGVTVKSTQSGDESYYRYLDNLNNSLTCYMSDYIKTEYRPAATKQGITIHCQKEFFSKQYPIRD